MRLSVEISIRYIRLDFKDKNPTAFVFTLPIVLSREGIEGVAPKRGLSQFPLLAGQTSTFVIIMPGKEPGLLQGLRSSWV